MKLTVLGTAAGGIPRAGDAGSGFLVEHRNTRLLVDCGNGVLGQLRKTCEFERIDAVLISHMHFDHCADLLPLLLYYYNVGTLPIWAPAGSDRVLNRFINLFSSHPNTLKRICKINTMTDTAKFGQIRASFIPVEHGCSPQCHAIRMESAGKQFIYIPDTRYVHRLTEFASGADLLLCAASFQHPGPRNRALLDVHMTARQAGEIARTAKVKHLILTHILQSLDFEVSQREAAAACNAQVSIAIPGMQLAI